MLSTWRVCVERVARHDTRVRRDRGVLCLSSTAGLLAAAGEERERKGAANQADLHAANVTVRGRDQKPPGHCSWGRHTLHVDGAASIPSTARGGGWKGARQGRADAVVGFEWLPGDFDGECGDKGAS